MVQLQAWLDPEVQIMPKEISFSPSHGSASLCVGFMLRQALAWPQYPTSSEILLITKAGDISLHQNEGKAIDLPLFLVCVCVYLLSKARRL